MEALILGLDNESMAVERKWMEQGVWKQYTTSITGNTQRLRDEERDIGRVANGTMV
jgi:hypothetical protein